MAIQKSVLDRITIAELLQRFYNVSVDIIEKIETGSANCWKICAANQCYFLKEYQESFSESDLEREARLNRFLLSAAFPTAALLPDVNGRAYHRINHRFVVLQEYIDGQSYVNHDLPDGMLLQAARWLGKLHEVLHDYEMPVEMDKAWVEKFNPDRARSGYDALLGQTESISDKQIRERIRADLRFKKELLGKIVPYGAYFDTLTYKSSHGDYSAMQLLCEGDNLKAVIDFASAARVPACWELMRSYMQSAIDTSHPADFDVHKFCDYVGQYQNVSALSKDDLKYMPYIYLYQLGRSRYGYKEYMSGAENRDSLLKFALWRTDVCRMLVHRADKISHMLEKC